MSDSTYFILDYSVGYGFQFPKLGQFVENAKNIYFY